MSSDDNFLFVGYGRGNMVQIDTGSKTVVHDFEKLQNGFWTFLVPKDGDFIIILCEDETLYFYNIVEKTFILDQRLNANVEEEKIQCMCLSQLL